MNIKGLTGKEIFSELKEKYGDDVVMYAISHTHIKSRYFLCEIFGIDDKVANHSNEVISENEYGIDMALLISKLEEDICKFTAHNIEESKAILERFKDMYGEDKLKDVIAFLGVKASGAIGCVLGYRDGREMNLTEINKVLNIKNSEQIISYAVSELDDILVKIDAKKKKALQQLKDLMKKYGEANTLQAFKEYGKQWSDIIFIYFGLDGAEPGSCQEVNDILMVNVTSHEIFATINKVESNLKKEISIRKKFTDIVKKYGQQRVNQVVNNMSEPEKRVVEMRFGINGHNKTSYADIQEKIDTLESRKMVEEFINTFASLEAKTPVVVQPEQKRKPKSLVIKSKDKNEIKEAIDKLPRTEKLFISSFYGMNGCKRLSGEAMEMKFRMSYDEVLETLEDVIEKINDSINNNRR